MGNLLAMKAVLGGEAKAEEVVMASSKDTGDAVVLEDSAAIDKVTSKVTFTRRNGYRGDVAKLGPEERSGGVL